ncbi:MAG: ABC transporter ATP-binding protein [Advenella sp.]
MSHSIALIQPASDKAPLLDVRNIRTCFSGQYSKTTVIEDVSFQLHEGQVVALVGESGSGKSITAFSIMGLLSASGRIEAGQILFDGKDLTAMSAAQLRQIQGNEMSIIFQEPLTSLNPLFTIGYQIGEVIELHQKVNKKEAAGRSIEMLSKMGMPHPQIIHDSYPHELSGGMRQRVMIAMALSCNPKLLIADEPTTALDVTIQAQILDLMNRLREERNMAIVLITHDLGVVAEIADSVIVMYAGNIVEQGDVYELFAQPQHPYTKGLLNSTLTVDAAQPTALPIPGSVPSPDDVSAGCRYQPRCPYAFEKCTNEMPPLQQIRQNYRVRCWLHQNAGGAPDGAK